MQRKKMGKNDGKVIVGGTAEWGKTILMTTFFQQDEFRGFLKLTVDPSGKLAK